VTFDGGIALALWACCLAAALQSWNSVNPRRTSEDRGVPVPTLGDLLPGERSGEGIAEHDWVRLVHAIARGEQQALRSLYERTHRIVFTLAMRICGNRETAEEVTLDVFHDVWRSSAQFDPTAGSVVGWIMIQARSRAIDRVRFDQRKKRVDPHPNGPDDLVQTRGPGDAIDAVEQRRSLERALTDLTSDERDAIETAFFSERTYSETAAHLAVPLGTVKTRVRSALAKLRKALGCAGGGS
jgi:RNA polymerase sigma-70 factor, ECF subfamily